MLPFARMVKYGNIAPAPPKFKKILANNYNVAVLTSSGDLYVRGQNSNGLLGLGHKETVTTWTLSTSGVEDFWLSTTSLVIKKFNNEIWYSGSSTTVGMTGAAVSVWTSAMPTFNTLTLPILDMAVSNQTTSVLLSDRTIWSTGAGAEGQLGNGTTTNNVNTKFVQSTVSTEEDQLPFKLFASNLMHGYVTANGWLYYTGRVNAISTSGTSLYTVYTSAPTSLRSVINIEYYVNNNNSMAMAIGTDPNGKTIIANGGAKRFGAQADGVNSTDIRAFAVQTASLMPPGDVLSMAHNTSYYNQVIATTDGIYCCGYNQSTQAGMLGVGTSTNALVYTKAIVPDGFDYSKSQMSGGYNRTYITDGNFVYSTGADVTYGGINSLVFVIDSPF
ncbi:hypothetical protein VWH05_05860 [Escherichia coli O157]|nr:hypothetical protein [Escherichia coli]MED6562313.1 hypothetical protein [Escherichia coli O157]MED6971096.1 hypothetical protein [Escherichia coli O157]HAO2010366.1 hypothetical protein [Escherichia coli]